MKKTLPVLALLICACQTTNDELLIGTWHNESMEVHYNYDGTKGDSIFSVPAGKWEEVLNIKPIETTYLADGTFTSVYIGLDGKKLQESTGKWAFEGDTLWLDANGDKAGYFFEWYGNKASFTGLIDWDGDGSKDDLYIGIQLKE